MTWRTVDTLTDRLGFPRLGEHGRFAGAIAIDAIGSGVFMPVCMLYFLVTTDLTLVQVGAALSIASAVCLPAGPLLGGLVDRWGAKQVLLAGNVLEGVGFLAYLVSDSFAAVLSWTVVETLGRTAFWGSYGNLVAAITRPGEREKWFGFLGALRNVGFAVGGLLAGLVVSIGTPTAYSAVVLANAASYVAAFVLLLGVPASRGPAAHRGAGGWGTVLRDRPYWLLWLAQLAFSLAMMVLNFAIPVYATTVLGLPGWVVGLVFVLNCAMIGLGQGLTVRAMVGHRRWRVLVLTNLAFIASYAVLLAAGALPVALGTVAVVAATIVYTMGELLGGPVHGALSAEAAPEHLRGRYLSLIQVAWNLAAALAPVAFAWLLDRGSAPLWWGLAVVAAGGIAASARLPRVLPAADEPVTDRAHEEPVAR